MRLFLHSVLRLMSLIKIQYLLILIVLLHFLNNIESYSYLANHLKTVLYDTLLQSDQKFSHDPYISISGKIKEIKFQHTILYRQIIDCSTTNEYILLLERDLLNLLEPQTSYLFQYPIANKSMRDKRYCIFERNV